MLLSARRMAVGRFWKLLNVYDGPPKHGDFELCKEELPDVKDGQFLVEAEAWSVDPYMRAYVGSVLAYNGTKFPIRAFGAQVAKNAEAMIPKLLIKKAVLFSKRSVEVIESKNSAYPVGCHVVNHNGWCSHSVLSDKGAVGIDVWMSSAPYKVLELPGVPMSYAVGVLGMPGMTAYFGVEEILKPKAGETMLVTGAAGAVGSIVGQLGKAKGCNVIGTAGSEDKVAWLKSLGFDHAFNYKTADVPKALKEAAPKGIHTFFDNVGGEVADAAYKQLAMDARIAQCGIISQYNMDMGKPPQVTDFRGLFVGKRTTLSGLHVNKYSKDFPKGIRAMAGHLDKGDVQAKETRYEGLEEIPYALMRMLEGENTGKAVVIAKAKL